MSGRVPCPSECMNEGTSKISAFSFRIPPLVHEYIFFEKNKNK